MALVPSNVGIHSTFLIRQACKMLRTFSCPYIHFDALNNTRRTIYGVILAETQTADKSDFLVNREEKNNN